MPGTGFKSHGQKSGVMVCLDSSGGYVGLAFIQFLKGHEPHDYCHLKTKFLPDQHYDFSITLVTRLFTMQHFDYSLTIDETSRLATAGLVTSTRVVSCWLVILGQMYVLSFLRSFL